MTIRLVSKRLCGGRCAWTMRIASRQAASTFSSRGQRDEPAVGLAQRGEVADLRHRDQPLVGRVGLRDALEQVDLLVRGRQPGEVELAQPLQLQALGDPRVQAADQPVLGQPTPATGPRCAAPPGTGRKVKWWCISAPPPPATVTVTRSTRAGQRLRARSARRGAAAIASAVGLAVAQRT